MTENNKDLIKKLANLDQDFRNEYAKLEKEIPNLNKQHKIKMAETIAVATVGSALAISCFITNVPFGAKIGLMLGSVVPTVLSVKLTSKAEMLEQKISNKKCLQAKYENKISEIQRKIMEIVKENDKTVSKKSIIQNRAEQMEK